MRRLRRARTTELAACIGALALASLVFMLWPQLDLAISGLFYDPAHGFAAAHGGWRQAVYVGVPWLGRALGVALIVSLWCARRSPRRVPPPVLRARWALLVTLALGVGAVVDGGLKSHWGRPRPHTVQQFGGTQVFARALSPSTQCRRNCSFVSGHAATGFALMAVAMFAAPARRRRWWYIGWACGGFVGWVRIMQGGHFASDVVFSGLVMWSLCLATRAVWLRRCALLSARLRIGAAQTAIAARKATRTSSP